MLELTPEEAKLYALIPTELESGMDWPPIADAMASLVTSLRERDAIPEVRMRVFNDPRFAEFGSKSPLEVFESNGTRGNDILRHGHFVEWIHYFVNGPDLPQEIISGFPRKLREFVGTSGMELTERRRLTREYVRKHCIDRHRAAREFFRLGLEIGLSPDESRSIREAALSVR